MKQPVFTGYGLMMVTPMTRTGIDFQTLDGLLGRQLDSGCKAFFVGGTAGQGNLMTDAELTALRNHLDNDVILEKKYYSVSVDGRKSGFVLERVE